MFHETTLSVLCKQKYFSVLLGNCRAHIVWVQHICVHIYSIVLCNSQKGQYCTLQLPKGTVLYSATPKRDYVASHGIHSTIIFAVHACSSRTAIIETVFICAVACFPETQEQHNDCMQLNHTLTWPLQFYRTVSEFEYRESRSALHLYVGSINSDDVTLQTYVLLCIGWLFALELFTILPCKWLRLMRVVSEIGRDVCEGGVMRSVACAAWKCMAH